MCEFCEFSHGEVEAHSCHAASAVTAPNLGTAMLASCTCRFTANRAKRCCVPGIHGSLAVSEDLRGVVIAAHE